VVVNDAVQRSAGGNLDARDDGRDDHEQPGRADGDTLPGDREAG